VRDPRGAVVAFAGSRAVGLEIIAAAGEIRPGQAHVKSVVAEMGGKSAIIVDASADLDEAVLGVRRSAFGYQGQKRSACARVIAVESIYDTFLERLCESTQAMSIGDPLEPAVGFGPVIDDAAAESIRAMIEVGRSEARLALEMELPDASRLAPGRAYVAPHVFAEVPFEARIAQEEIFGPVLCVMKARSFEEALGLATTPAGALSAGVYSRKPSNLSQARARLRVGNLYLNRPITGALVGRQPTGGLGLSGTGAKAGGPEYLLHFVEPRTICENTMRRGFAPDLD
jgi:RHH-type proline utilization regulon transcriptional repressor/proline dehydrogenase/delta 1-pyrroline-5-carboxylate dehydrogenase